MRLKKATYRHIEAEIYAYEDTVLAIEDMRQDILHSSGRGDAYGATVSDGHIGTSIVERRAIKLADSALLREMERITKSIRRTYGQANELCRQIVWLKYGLAIDWDPGIARREEDCSVRQMAYNLAIDESTFHRYKTGFIYGVAEKLGWW